MFRKSHKRVGAAVSFEGLEDRRLFAVTPGTLDATFHHDGLTDLPMPSGNNSVYAAVVVQPDGKTLVAGLSMGSPDKYYVYRYAQNGLLDHTFSDDGIVTISVNNGSGAKLALQTDGKIILAGGMSGADYKGRGMLARFDANGAFDKSFDGDGIVITPLNWNIDSWNSVSTAPGGKIVVGGSTTDQASAIARYNANGTPDTTFDGDGRRGIKVAASTWIKDIHVMNDGRIVAGGTASDPNGFNSVDTLLVRLKTNGSYDTTFSGDGVQRWDYSNGHYDTFNSIHVFTNGDILAAGQCYNGSDEDSTIWRLKANGATDANFGVNGKAVPQTGYSPYTQIVVQKTGHILAFNANAVRVDRFLANGKPDSDFKISPMGIEVNGWQNGFAIAPSGLDKIVVVGEGQTPAGTFPTRMGRFHAGSVPYAPKDALAFVQSNTEIKLHWTDSSANESIFQIHMAKKADFSDAYLLLAAKDTTSKLMNGLQSGTTYYFRVLAANSYGKSEWSPVTSMTTNGVAANPPAPAPALSTIRINTGGSAFTDATGKVWGADQHYTGGTNSDGGATVAGTTDDKLYSDRRGGTSFQYAIPVANGSYSLKLHFAEMYYSGAGQRKFDVFAEGATILDDLDIYAAAGAKTALVKSMNVTVKDGVLNLNFTGVIGSAVVSGIELVPA